MFYDLSVRDIFDPTYVGRWFWRTFGKISLHRRSVVDPVWEDVESLATVKERELF